MNIGDKLRDLRIKANLSRKEAANKLGIAHQTLGHWETSRTEPSSENIIKLAKIYNTSVSEIYGEKVPETNEIDKFIGNLITEWKKDGTLNDVSSFDDLDIDSQEIIKHVISKYIKNKNSH